MANSSTVTKKLQAMGLPMEMVRGEDYWYFVYGIDDGAPSKCKIWDTKSEYVYRFDTYTEKEWVRMGVEFACKLLTNAAR